MPSTVHLRRRVDAQETVRIAQWAYETALRVRFWDWRAQIRTRPAMRAVHMLLPVGLAE
jgi:hypothetical protein